jgi:photosystem II stability/assembly factor-like uncharacterized protein
VGLPALTGKMDLAVTPDDASRIYLLVEAPREEEGLYRSNDRGETWRHVSDEGGLMRRPFYYTNVDADPTDADVVYVNNESFFKSTDGGYTFERRSTPHGDNHDMWINPDNPDIMVQSNDGGANVTLDGGRTWSSQRNQMTAELYQVDIDDHFPYRLYAGQQDNGTTIAVTSLPVGPREDGYAGVWEELGGCETGPAVPRPGNPDIIYSNCKGRFYRYNRVTGTEQEYYVGAVDMYGVDPSTLPYRFQRVVPIEVSPHDPDVIYHGSQYVHRTTDEGRNWEQISPDLTAFLPERQMVSGSPITRDITGEEHYSTLYAIEESPVAQGVIWAGANDGPVHVTRDGGESWIDVTPPMPPEGRIQTIEPSPHHAGKAYVAAYRYLLNDFRPYIWRTEDFGETWILLTNRRSGIPEDTPTRVIREDPDREGLLYAGTDFGLYVSLDDGASWHRFQGDLPATPITDMKVHRKDLVMSTMGRGFWILDDLSWLHQLTPEAAAEPAFLFAPRDAIRMRYRVFRGAAEPEWLPPGATIWYHLSGAAGSVVLEILDERGGLIRRFAAGETESLEEEVEGMRGLVGVPVETRGVRAEAGLHRFIWDLQYTGYETPDGARRSGPMATPGAYSVRLTVDGVSQTQPLVVRVDPRVAADGVTQDDMEAQFAHNMEVAGLLNRFADLVRDVEAALEEAEEGSEAAVALEGLHAALVTDNSDSYPARMLDSQLRYLYGMTTSADQRPGEDAYVRFEDLEEQVNEALEALAQILEGQD